MRWLLLPVMAALPVPKLLAVPVPALVVPVSPVTGLRAPILKSPPKVVLLVKRA